MQSAAMIEARKNGKEVFPVLIVNWLSRGYDLGTEVYAPGGRLTDAGGVTRVTRPGGWSDISYGSGVRKGMLQTVGAEVSVTDKDGELLNMLDTYDPRGSVCSMYEAAEGLVQEDWEPVFVGLVSDWQKDNLYTRIEMKTDDTVLRRPIPSPTFVRSEWSSAYDTTIFGTNMPLVVGVHDSYQITARGMVPAVNLQYDKDLGYWWLATLGHGVDVRKIYYDGDPVTGGGWSVRRGVWGGNRLTIIDINEGYQPEEGVVVAFDFEGADDSGLEVGSTETRTIRLLRMILEEYTYRDAPLGAWVGDHSIIDDTSWDSVLAFFDARGYDTAKRFGGDQNQESAAEVVESFLKSHTWARIWWTPLGKLALGVMDPDDVDPDDAAWLDVEAYSRKAMLDYGPGDRREVYTHVKQPFLYSNAEQKFLSSYEAHDVAALDENVELSVPNEWTHARFTLT